MSRGPDPASTSAEPEAGTAGPPLTARSVILSVLLGSHPPLLPVRVLVRSAELFGISEGTTRTALSRLTAEGDVEASGRMYHLSPRLLERQWQQDSSLRPHTRPWRGVWEMAIARPEVASAADRSAIGAELAQLRLAELRPGVWGRPDNLLRDWPEDITTKVLRFSARPDFRDPSPGALASAMWDLTGWAAAAERLIADLAGSAEPADRFVVAAAMVRHLRADPLLPASLHPERWPGGRLRAAYDAYRKELAQLLEAERERSG